ncbi:hypothetical protein AgCh_001879 [Apium graveolens]
MLDASLSPDKEPLPDCRTSDPKLLGAKCRILQSLPTRTPVDYKDRAPKAHTRFHPTSPMRTPIDYRRRPSVQAYPWRPKLNEQMQYCGWSDEISCKGEGPSFRGQRSNDGKFGEGKPSEIPWSVGQVFDESRVNFNTGHLAGITSASATFAFIKVRFELVVLDSGQKM